MCTRLCCVCALRFCCSLCCTGVMFCSVCAAWLLYLCSVFCVCVYLVSVYCVCMCVQDCVHIVCVLCAYCVHLVCVSCICSVCVREVSGWGCVTTQSDTPHVGYLCGYMVRIIKYKKTQPLIKLKSIWFSTFLLYFKIILLLSEKVSIK